jgi:hypothetical protein
LGTTTRSPATRTNSTLDNDTCSPELKTRESGEVFAVFLLKINGDFR